MGGDLMWIGLCEPQDWVIKDTDNQDQSTSRVSCRLLAHCIKASNLFILTNLNLPSPAPLSWTACENLPNTLNINFGHGWHLDTPFERKQVDLLDNGKVKAADDG